MNKTENGLKVKIDFKKMEKIYKEVIKNGHFVIPVVVQDITTKEILILSYINQRALKLSIKKGMAIFWSTSRNELWIKGATSGSMLKLVETRINCEQNSLLFLVKPISNKGTCHSKDKNGNFRRSCFYRKLKNINSLKFID